MTNVIHKIPQNFRFFVFLPWLTFLNQGGSAIPDQARLRVAVAEDCKKIDRPFNAVVANSPASRARGLGGRATPLSPDEAMLFIFEQARPVSFWMKDTLIPLQIGYFDSKGTLQQTYEMAVEKNPANPVKDYSSNGEVITALEVAPYGLKKAKLKKSMLCIDTLPR